MKDFTEEHQRLYYLYIDALNEFNDVADSFAWLGHLVEEEAKKHGLQPIIPDELEDWERLEFVPLNEGGKP